MKRCKAEYLLIKKILLKSLICKGCTFYLRLFRLACLPCIHYMHLDGYFSVIWKAVTLLILLKKKSLTLYCLITWNENYASMVIHCCRESQSCSITQFNNSNPTPDNSTQITIALCTYTYLHVDWPTSLKTLLTLTLNSYSLRGCELAGLYCIYVFGMPMKDWQQRLWVKQ